MQKIDISIVIISSKKDFLFDCLESLYKALSGINSEVILIDNVSQDKIGDLAKKKYPQLKVLRREVNGGFGENNNMGMKIAKGRYVLLLNDDTKIIDRSIFRERIEWMDKHPKVGISTCALVNPDLVKFQGSGGSFPSLFRVFAWMTFLDDIPGLDNLIKPYHPMHMWSPISKNEDYFKEPHKQDWLTGAFFLMRKAAMDEAGLFDEDFFLYVEEVELSYRFAKKGWEAWYLPEWRIVHYGMSTNGSEKATIFEFQNLVLMYSKHEPKWKIPFLRMILKLGALLRIIMWTVAGKGDVAKIYAKALNSI
ncbi:MAG: glycosyltransferase family 2 protein [Candidatus Methanofastidiosa archaeon]|nr:glycosyltransferase family 2 protein [Candidatus Methanofastidiosa archaeon]